MTGETLLKANFISLNHDKFHQSQTKWHFTSSHTVSSLYLATSNKPFLLRQMAYSQELSFKSGLSQKNRCMGSGFYKI